LISLCLTIVFGNICLRGKIKKEKQLVDGGTTYNMTEKTNVQTFQVSFPLRTTRPSLQARKINKET
jgi:hypothetical protein